MINRTKAISDHLKELGVSASLNGYRYLRYGISRMAEDITLMDAITKRLYPEIAQTFNTTASRVEKGIRTAIESGWDRGNRESQKRLFGYTVDMNKGKPTNCEFIVTVADYVLMCESDGADNA